jgi:hypothetical protein
MPNDVFGRVELLIDVVKIAIPIIFGVLVVLFVGVAVFVVRYRKALKHKILSLPVRTVHPRGNMRRRTSGARQQAQQ